MTKEKKTTEKSVKKARKSGEPKLSKRMQAVREGLEKNKLYTLDEAITVIKARAKAKFDETLEVAVSLGIDPKQTDQAVRGVVSMPNGLGKTVRVAVFAKGPKAEEAKKAGADIVGAEELGEQVEKGLIQFDRCIATPDMMGVVGKLGKVLGPRGLMPNPKLGTVTMDVAKAVEAAKSGQVEFRGDKAGIIHAGLGKASFTDANLAENIKAFFVALQGSKPANVKGNFIKKASLSSTMGPSVRLDLTTLSA